MGTEVDQGHLQLAPESFLSTDLIDEIQREGIDSGRRTLIRGAIAAAAAVVAVPHAASADDPDIVNLPNWTRSLGKPVVANPYGQPSPFEANIVRRQSPGLTRTDESSVSFTPLQNLFGMITPSGLHFERHHQGWVDIDPRRHRLMINGLVKTPLVFTMEELLRMPSVSRIHFLECGANTGLEWGNVAVPTVQYTHGMLSSLLLLPKPSSPDVNQATICCNASSSTAGIGGIGTPPHTPTPPFTILSRK